MYMYVCMYIYIYIYMYIYIYVCIRDKLVTKKLQGDTLEAEIEV
jgi:hypothetical protein